MEESRKRSPHARGDGPLFTQDGVNPFAVVPTHVGMDRAHLALRFTVGYPGSKPTGLGLGSR